MFNLNILMKFHFVSIYFIINIETTFIYILKFITYAYLIYLLNINNY